MMENIIGIGYFEPNNNRTAVGLDCNTAHLQPTDNNSKGLIHYHGDMVVYANSLLAGLGDGTTEPTASVQIGWASDGFPIVYKYGPNAAGTDVELLESSYQLKTGERPGDGMTEPCGDYNGKYTNDYEFVSGSGDLDECNGIERSITLNTPAGVSETFSYFYVITDEFPVIGRCLSGTPDEDFFKKNHNKRGLLGGLLFCYEYTYIIPLFTQFHPNFMSLRLVVLNCDLKMKASRYM